MIADSKNFSTGGFDCELVIFEKRFRAFEIGHIQLPFVCCRHFCQSGGFLEYYTTFRLQK